MTYYLSAKTSYPELDANYWVKWTPMNYAFTYDAIASQSEDAFLVLCMLKLTMQHTNLTF